LGSGRSVVEKWSRDPRGIAPVPFEKRSCRGKVPSNEDAGLLSKWGREENNQEYTRQGQIQTFDVSGNREGTVANKSIERSTLGGQGIRKGERVVLPSPL